MKGMIFLAFEDFVVANWGEDTFDDILAETQLETTGPFVATGFYPPTDLLALVNTACDVLDVDLDDAIKAFASHAFPLLAESVLPLMEQLPDLRTFLMQLESLIHTEIRKLHPEADPARLTIEETDCGDLMLHYASPLGLYAMVEGLLDGAATWYGESIKCDLVSTEGTNGIFRLQLVDEKANLNV